MSTGFKFQALIDVIKLSLPPSLLLLSLPARRSTPFVPDNGHSLGALFRPLFRDGLKTEAKLKIVDKHLTEKRKLAADVKSRMEKHGKTVEDIKVKWD